jgi:hypothetical protein
VEQAPPRPAPLPARQVTTPRRPVAPTRPPPSASSAPAPFPGGYAIVLGKSMSPDGSRYLLRCTNLDRQGEYVFEVDADTFNEAAPDLMYHPGKIAKWRLISSQ